MPCSTWAFFVHVLVDGNQTLKEAHNLTEEIELVIQQLMPNADVTVHPEPNSETALKA